jgi:uncharacterized protein (TIGR03067 family)
MHGKSLLLVLLPLAIVGCGKQSTSEELLPLRPFHGTWEVLSFNDRGEEANAETVKHMTLAVENETARLAVEGKVVVEMILRMPATGNPGEIDLIPLSGDNPGQPELAIYAFEGNRLKLCIAGFDQPRPTEFEVLRGMNRILLVLQRRS